MVKYMNTYLFSIKTAIIVFPIIAFIITLPFMIYNYNKYGSINKLRTLIIYSFVLYLLCAYFLVILPLPSKEYVSTLKTPRYQLELFRFIKDFINYSGFKINNINTYNIALKSPLFYQPLYNIILTIPFGIYLRYYYKCNLLKTIMLSFLLSLFFEVTQITGLYGIYSRNYRLFDVDDLLLNTFGGIIGYLLSGLFIKILPSRDNIDEKSYEEGKKVSGIRRLFTYFIDQFFSLLLFLFLNIILIFKNYINNFLEIFIIYIICNYIIYVIVPLIYGKTIGKSITKLSIRNKNTKLHRIFLRCNLQFIYLNIIPLIIIILAINGIMFSFIALLIYIIFIFIDIYKLLSNKELWYEKVTKTKNISTVIKEITPTI